MRRALETLGLKVNRLIRVSYGPFQLDDLAPGAIAEVEPAELLAEFSQFISEKRRPQPFAKRDVKRGKPIHAKQEKPKGEKARPKSDKHQGVDSYVDPRKQRTERKDEKRPPGGRGPHSGKRHTGKPVRAKQDRGPRTPR